MCESHMNDAVRAAFPVKKVTSSHSKGETVIVTEQDIPDELLKSTIAKTGYELVSISRAPYEKKGLFGKLLNADKHCPASSARSTKWRVNGDAYVSGS